MPTSKGALLSYLSDFTPGYGVGEFVYEHFAHTTIRKWLEKVAYDSECKTAIYGHSLGGSLALYTVAANRDLVAEVHSFAPSAVSQKVLSYYDANTTNNKVSIFLQKNDLTPYREKVGTTVGTSIKYSLSGHKIYY